MNIAKPNIFSFGTTELTQDAVVAWMIAWAHPAYKKTNLSLHRLGKNILERIFAASEKQLPELRTVIVQTQIKNMDVYVAINDEYHVIIEDKTFGDTKDEQIERYVNQLKKQGIDALNIVPIYYKTRDQARRKQDLKRHPTLTRKEMIELLNQSIENGLSHDLMVEYRTYLKTIDDNVEAYKTIAPSKWESPQWRGFFKLIDRKYHYPDNKGWSKVNNPRNAFMGYWWNYKNFEDYTVYNQIEENKLCFKISSHQGRVKKELKWKWLELLTQIAQNHNVTINKPKRFGSGKTVTYAVWEKEDSQTWIPTKNDGSPDLEQAVKRLQKAADLLDKTVETYNGE